MKPNTSPISFLAGLTGGWFEETHKALRERLGIPKSLCFKTKVELAWELIEGVISRGLSFEGVGFDTLYGRSGWLRDKCGSSV